MDTMPEEEHPFYSQETAAAMHDKLEQQRDTIRQLCKLNGILHREADQQAATIQQLRDEIDDWRNRYLRAIAGERGNA